jgi:AraC-like DNA-binding protein
VFGNVARNGVRHGEKAAPMACATADFAPIRFSTDAIPMQDRAAVWREVHGRSVRTDIEPLSERLSVNSCLLVLPGLKVVGTESSGVRLTRTRALIADADDDFRLAINHSGLETILSRGREIEREAGDALLVCCSDFGVVTRPSSGRSLGIHVPRAVLAPLVANIDDAVMRPIPRDSEALRLLRSYIGIIQEQSVIAAPGLRHLAVTHVYDLVTLAVGATRDASALAEGRGVRAARLRSIKADIVGHLGRNDLTIDRLSRRHQLHPRYIQRLFESDGTTFSEFLLRQRLARAYRILTDPRRIDQSVGAIAFECGFGDLSYFNRRFRRTYGSVPSHFRASKVPM